MNTGEWQIFQANLVSVLWNTWNMWVSRRLVKSPVLNIYQEFWLLFHHSPIYTDRRIPSPRIGYTVAAGYRASRAYAQYKVEDENEIVKWNGSREKMRGVVEEGVGGRVDRRELRWGRGRRKEAIVHHRFLETGSGEWREHRVNSEL